MKIQLVRTQFGEDAVNGMLFVDGVFECYTLEDQYQEVKVYGETCIPEGTYPIEYRNEGGFFNRYTKKFPTIHKGRGMLEIKDIKDFKWVLFHLGNSDENSAGCVLVGSTQQDLDVSKDGWISNSKLAYTNFYPKVADALDRGEKVTLEITKINLGSEVSNKQSPDLIEPSLVKDDLSEIKGMIKILTAKLEGKNIT